MTSLLADKQSSRVYILYVCTHHLDNRKLSLLYMWFNNPSIQ
uniref:Uncharacterized protein n=1 Tax=Amphimedon queenslandica TaxID=400682 RepID=A0A1X7UJZ2_AMPQE